jgi:hypothetical protein
LTNVRVSRITSRPNAIAPPPLFSAFCSGSFPGRNRDGKLF